MKTIRRKVSMARPAVCRLGRFVLLAFLAFAGSAQAAAMPAVSPAMIAQLKSMPKDQQVALARQYGVDLETFMAAPPAGLAQPGQVLGQTVAPEPPIEKPPTAVELAAAELKYERFGEDLFNREVSTFAVTDDALVPNDYRLGPGDEVRIMLYGKDNNEHLLEIDRNGEILLPRVGALVVAGLRFEDARAFIQQRVKNNLVGVEANISLGRMRAISVFMAGEVQVPGAYSVSALSTVSQVLFVSGGVTNIGTLRNIQVKRGGATIATFDTYDLLLRGDAGQDVRLQSGDVVFVPPYERLAIIEGEVKRPMAYELLGRETAAQLVFMAGGFTRDAYPAAAVLLRKSQGQNLAVVKNINLLDIEQSVALVDGDRLRVPQAADTYENAITIKGAAVRPGIYAWSAGTRVSSLLRSVKVDLLPTVDLNYALIIREKNPRLEIVVKQFNLGDAMLNPGTDLDLALEPRDQLILFELVDLESRPGELEQVDLESRPGEPVLIDELPAKAHVWLNRNQLSDIIGDTWNGTASLKIDNAGELELVNLESRPGEGRATLLEPIIGKLRAQAKQGEPVQVVSISGAVKAPGEYPLAQGDRAFALVRAAGGFKDSALMAAAELRRMNDAVSGSVDLEYRELSFEAFGQLADANNLLLQSRDHITVRDIPDWNPGELVEVRGEVRFPGDYLIRRGETIAEIIARAGGLTEDAFPQGAIFTRVEIARLENERAAELARTIRTNVATSMLTQETQSIDLAEISSITETLQNFEGKGRLLLDLDKALAGVAGENLVLADGDRLAIPQKSLTVSIIGQVRRQGTHVFQSDYDVKDYVSLAAGMTSRADKKAMYIVKANGAVMSAKTSWLKFSNPQQQLAPGDTIVVPVNNRYKDNLSSWRDITQIVYQSAVALAAIGL